VFGDFDGDHRDEPFIIRGVNTGTPGQRQMRLGWGLTSTQLDWWPINDFGAGTPTRRRNRAIARVLAARGGRSQHDGRDEMVEVVRTTSGYLEINVWRLDDQSQMYFVAYELGELIATTSANRGSST